MGVFVCVYPAMVVIFWFKSCHCWLDVVEDTLSLHKITLTTETAAGKELPPPAMDCSNSN